MPRYSYICDRCEKVFSITHSMNEKIEAYDHLECKDGGKLRKLPSFFTKKLIKEKKVGEIVKKYIEDVKEEVKEEKEALKREEYKKEEK